MKIKIFRVAGSSMEPEFCDGDFVMVSKLPSRIKYVKPGTAIAFVHSRYGLLIKRVQHYNPILKMLWATGISSVSVRRDAIGPIPLTNVLGEVVGHVRKNPLHN